MRIALAFVLLLAACGRPCALGCANDADCPAGAYCYDRLVCLQGCDGVVCGNACVRRVANCTQCGAACDAGQVCSGNACKAACDQGLTACNGACTSLSADRFNCGACGHACAQNELCVSGACAAVTCN